MLFRSTAALGPSSQIRSAIYCTQDARREAPKTFLEGLTNPFQHKIAFHQQALIWLIFIDCY